ncbi:MAG: amidohydrolase family protein, partial [Lachnospiraceae bacterium]|nr:amidohydrolase family protein [Lachnospiraceae bacterium]
MRTLIQNGHVLNPSTQLDGIMDIAIENGKIVEISEKIAASDTDLVIDAKNKYVMPGFIDLHVHYREPGFEYKETIA